jgi:DNA polymerase-3 subunit delta
VTPEELSEELRRGTLRSVYLLAGPEALHRDDALAAIRAALFPSGGSDFDQDAFEGATASAGALRDALRTLPVLAPRRLVVVREPATRNAAQRALAEALAEIVPELRAAADVTLVITAASADRRERWVRACAEAGVLVECAAPKGARAIAAFVKAEARRQGVSLGAGAAELLAERIGPELLLLRHEIEKAALFAGPGRRVEREHVVDASCDVAEESLWDLGDAIGEGRLADALSSLARLLAGGAPPPVLLGALASHFRRLARTRDGAPPAAPPFVVRKLEEQARRYPPARLLACLRAIHVVDEALKGEGRLPPDLALERLVMGLSA